MKTLEHLKVIDLSSILAGPLAGRFFAELGAKVIKIENKLTEGDPTRQWRAANEASPQGFSAYYASANYGKDVIMCDLTLQRDREKLFELMKDADVIITNFQKKTAIKLELTPEQLHEFCPQAVIAQLNAYDYDDPRPGYDVVMQAEAGYIHMTGTDANHLAKMPVAMIDVLASHQLREAILLGLYQKMRTGEGSIYHVSLYKVAISGLINQAADFLTNGNIPKPIGTLHPQIAPYGDILTTKDGHKIMLAVGSDAQFKKLWDVLNLNLKDIVSYASNHERVQVRFQLVTILQQASQSIDFDDLVQKLNYQNIPYAVIDDMTRVFEKQMSIDMIREESPKDNYVARSVSTIAFKKS